MFQTIKAKIVLVTFFTIFVCFVVASILMYEFYFTNQKSRNSSCDYTVEYYAQKINTIIARLSDFDKSFALKGELFYNKTNRNHKDLDDIALKALNASEHVAFGGGIFFEPYAIGKDKKRFCSYAFNKKNSYVVDSLFEGEKYDYHNQMWYKYLKDSIVQEGIFSFTKPYVDEAGTKALMITLGSGIFQNNKFVGIATVDWMLDEIIDTLKNIKPTPNTFVLFADTKNDSIIVLNYKNDFEKYIGSSLKTAGWYKNDIQNATTFRFDDVEYISFSRQLLNNMIIVINIPTEELYEDLNKTFLIIVTFAICAIILLLFVLRYVLSNNIEKPIDYILEKAKNLSEGNLNTKMNITHPKEFGVIAKTFNDTVDNLKEHIKNLSIANTNKQHYETELKISRTIQSSYLNKVFPPYTNRNEIDIYASMIPAKQVGGDFYDFFFLDKNHFVFLIADVSNKGVPAALFMVQSKNFVKNALETTNSLNEAVQKANSMLCRANDIGLFVSSFIAVLDTDTGRLRYVNAGHNQPLIKRKDSKYEFLPVENNIALGKMEDIEYVEQEITLQKDESVFLYTEGVIKSQNSRKEFYEKERLQKVLNEEEYVSSKEVIKEVSIDIDSFIDEVEQNDDRTMLHITYNGKDDSNFVVQSDISHWRDLQDFLINDMTSKSISEEVQKKVIVSSEEIFMNAVKYAYNKVGSIWVKILKEENSYKMIFSNYGRKHNPLEHDMEITLFGTKHKFGGLGLILAQKYSNNIEYKYEHLQNILTITFLF